MLDAGCWVLDEGCYRLSALRLPAKGRLSAECLHAAGRFHVQST